MQYELIKRGRTSYGVETMYKSSLSLEESEDLRMVQEQFSNELRSALGIEYTSGLQLYVLVDLAEGVYLADIIEKDEQRLNYLPKTIVTNR